MIGVGWRWMKPMPDCVAWATINVSPPPPWFEPPNFNMPRFGIPMVIRPNGYYGEQSRFKEGSTYADIGGIGIVPYFSGGDGVMPSSSFLTDVWLWVPESFGIPKRVWCNPLENGTIDINPTGFTNWRFTPGVTYTVTYLYPWDDLSNVGFVSVGLPFVATDAIANHWVGSTIRFPNCPAGVPSDGRIVLRPRVVGDQYDPGIMDGEDSGIGFVRDGYRGKRFLGMRMKDPWVGTSPAMTLFLSRDEVALPTFAPLAGTYGSYPLGVTLSTTTSGASITHKVFSSGDPAEIPTPGSNGWSALASALVTGVIVTVGHEIRAQARKSGWAPSLVSIAAYS